MVKKRRFSQWKTSFYAGFTKIRRKIRDSKRPYVAQQRKMECAPGKSGFGKNNPICPFGKNTRSKTERVSLCIIACTLMPFLYMPDVLCVLSHRPVGGEGSSGGDILETLPPKAQPILIVPIGSELGVQVAGKVLEQEVVIRPCASWRRPAAPCAARQALHRSRWCRPPTCPPPAAAGDCCRTALWAGSCLGWTPAPPPWSRRYSCSLALPAGRSPRWRRPRCPGSQPH